LNPGSRCWVNGTGGGLYFSATFGSHFLLVGIDHALLADEI
jgi:hypothetical protein